MKYFSRYITACVGVFALGLTALILVAMLVTVTNDRLLATVVAQVLGSLLAGLFITWLIRLFRRAHPFGQDPFWVSFLRVECWRSAWALLVIADTQPGTALAATTIILIGAGVLNQVAKDD